MQEIWESYMKPMEGQPASVAFNAEAAETAPDGELGVVGFVKVKLNAPTARGLISEGEADDIGFVEDRLEMEALRYRIGKYIGRIVSDGGVHFIFYLKYDFEWPDAVSAAMAPFGQYAYEAGSRPDPEWGICRALLLPTEREWQMIRNHHACDRLKSAGDALQTERAIEHRSYFESAEGCDGFAERIAAEGFRVLERVPPSETQLQYGLRYYRSDLPHYYDIDAVTLLLIDLGEMFGGIYDGWETSLVKQ